MLEDCDLFVFTLGLTERWQSIHDGAVFPVVPQSVAAIEHPQDYEFANATVAEMTHDLCEFIDRLTMINPSVKIILTVSPVPLIATFEPNHVLVSNAYSKAALRVVAEETIRAYPHVAYFPSYEIITAPHLASNYFGDDLREIQPEGVDHAVAVFLRHFTGPAVTLHTSRAPGAPYVPATGAALEEALLRGTQGVICDEEIVEITR